MYKVDVTSKYLVGAVMLCLQIYIPNMNFYSGEAVMTVEVGFGFFYTMKAVVMEVLSMVL